MKFRHYLEHITGIGIYPLTSLVIFFTFFTVLAIWAYQANRTYINEVKNIPLNDNN